MEEQNSIASSKKWILQAIHDKDMAQAIISVEAYDTSAFLSHQSVEKLLKGLLIIQGLKVPRHHHLDLLAEQLGVLNKIRDNIGEILSDYQITRYPDVSGEVPFHQYTRKIALDKFEHANSIFKILEPLYREYV